MCRLLAARCIRQKQYQLAEATPNFLGIQLDATTDFILRLSAVGTETYSDVQVTNCELYVAD